MLRKDEREWLGVSSRLRTTSLAIWRQTPSALPSSSQSEAEVVPVKVPCQASRNRRPSESTKSGDHPQVSIIGLLYFLCPQSQAHTRPRALFFPPMSTSRTSALLLLAAACIPSVVGLAASTYNHSLANYANVFVNPKYVIAKNYSATTTYAQQTILRWADDSAQGGPWSKSI